jgi:deoxycytidine triphosphate deaminase
MRKVTLIDKGYHVVKEIMIPREKEWPAVIRYGERFFSLYAFTMTDTIEAKAQADDEGTYREVKVLDATPPV